MSTNITLPPESISVIICAYTQERWDKLTCAIESIHQQTHPAQEIIVVIDHNPELLQKAQRELLDVQVIENTQKRGLSGARNSGIAVACGTLIAFLDDDAIAEPDWLWHMYTALADTHISGVGSAVLPDWEGHKPPWFPAEFYWVVGCSYRGMPCTSAPIRNPIGAGMCIRREVFQAVGGFRSEIGRVGTLPVGCEETELCIRARQHWPDRYFMYIPQVHVSHHVPTKRTTWRYFCSRCYAEGISKAIIARFVGTKDSLSSEFSYTLQTLPTGFLQNLGLAIIKDHFDYILRALAIIVGLCITMTGYLVGKYISLSSSEDVEGSSETVGRRGRALPTKLKAIV
jgi:glucosyl-dolichyl phosphate glucuronosyltransferase